MAERPPPDPAKLLDYWQEWERGETLPGQVLANLKRAALPDLLQALVDALNEASEAEAAETR